MQYIYATVVAVLISVTVASAVPATLDARAPNPTDCIVFGKHVGTYDGTTTFSDACASMTFACLKENGTSIWSHPACVAAATCQGTRSVVTLNQCQNPKVLDAASIPNMASAVYGAMVGDCSSSNCPITQQNYVDFVFSQMSAVGVTNWPSVDDVVNNWWTPIANWAAAGDNIPYANFNDWLHFSNV